MKKRIFISFIFAIMSISIFTSQYYEAKKNALVDLINIGNTKVTYQVVFSVAGQDSKQLYNTITGLLDKYNGNMYSLDIDESNNYTKYIYFNNTQYFSNVILSKGRFFENNEKESNKFLSNQDSKDINQIGIIESFETTKDFKIKTLKSNLNSNSFNKNFTLLFESESDFQNFKGELQENEIFFETINNDSSQISYKILYLISFSVLFISLIIILLYDLLNSYKKIGIEKMLGFSNFDIWKIRILKIMKNCFAVFGISIIILPVIFFRKINKTILMFNIKILAYYLLITILTFIFCSLPFLYVKKVKIINMLKNNRPTNAIICLNTSLKIIMTCIFLIIFVSAFEQFNLVNSGYTDKYGNWENTKSYVKNAVTEYYVGTNEIDSFSEENMINCKSIYEAFNKNGGILAKFDSFQISDDKYKTGIAYIDNEIKVNPNYLKNNPLYDIYGNLIEISETNSNCVILIPEKYKVKEIEIREFYQKRLQSYDSDSSIANQNIDIIWIQNNQNFFSYRLDVNPNNNNSVENAIARVITEANAYKFDFLDVLGTGSFLIKVNDTYNAQSEVNRVIGEYYNLNLYSFPIINLYDSVNEQISLSKSMLAVYSIMLIILLILMTVVIMQNVTNYFEQNKTRLAVQKFLGFKLKDKYIGFYIIDICSLIISICFAWIFTKNIRILFVAIFISFVEFIITSVLLIINEKNNVLKITKGG